MSSTRDRLNEALEHGLTSLVNTHFDEHVNGRSFCPWHSYVDLAFRMYSDIALPFSDGNQLIKKSCTFDFASAVLDALDVSAHAAFSVVPEVKERMSEARSRYLARIPKLTSKDPSAEEFRAHTEAGDAARAPYEQTAKEIMQEVRRVARAIAHRSLEPFFTLYWQRSIPAERALLFAWAAHKGGSLLLPTVERSSNLTVGCDVIDIGIQSDSGKFKVDIEFDGPERDDVISLRDRRLKQLGWIVVRFSREELEADLEPSVHRLHECTRGA